MVIWLCVCLAVVAVWILVLQNRVSALELTIAHLRQLIAAPAPPGAVEPRAAPAPVATPAAREPAAIVAVQAPIAAPAPDPAVWSQAEPSTLVPRGPPTPPAQPGRSMATWLSENGLAWIGGGALAMGGVLLVAYAAQRGIFGPAVRIVCAIAAGFVMLAAGEWIRRRGPGRSGRHDLVSAMASGAGAATLYGAVWAAFQLYHFIPAELAGLLLALVSLGLLGLAFLHGQPLALLAVLAAFAVPVLVGGGPGWSAWAADVYLALVAGTGLTVAFLRRWAGAGASTLAVMSLWILQRLSGDATGAAVLMVLTPALTLAAAALSPRRDRAEATDPLLASLVALALVAGSTLWLVLCLRNGAGGPVAAVAGAVLALLAATAVRLRRVDGRIVAVPAVALVLAAVIAAVAAPAAGQAWLLIVVAATAVAAQFVSTRDPGNRLVPAAAGAGACALALTLLQGQSRAEFGMAGAVAIFAASAVLLAAGAWRLARRSPDPTADLAVAAWLAAAAESVGLLIHAGLDGWLQPTACGLLAAALCLCGRRLPWRGFVQTGVVAALASLAWLLSPQIAGAVLSGEVGWTSPALVAGGAVVAQVMAWGLVRGRAGGAASAEAISTSAWLSGLMGAFLVLHAMAAAGGQGLGLDHFAEAALRTDLLLCAGLILSLRGSPGVLGRLRGPVLLILGGLHGLVIGGLLENPLWGDGRAVSGPVIVDSLALAFLAPALLLAAVGRGPEVASAPGARRAAWMAAGVFAALWLALEIRRFFHGPDLRLGAVAYSEAAAYAVASIVLALTVFVMGTTRRQREELEPASGAPGPGAAAVLWAGLGLGLLLLGYTASPWWGPLHGRLQAPLLLLALYVAGLGLAGAAAVLARRAGAKALGVFALTAGIIEGLVLLSLVIRFGYLGADMRTALREASLETWTYSAAWAVYGTAVLVFGVRRREIAGRWLGLAVLLGTTLKVFLFDLARLDGVARAASFLVLGALLLAGALAARRLSSAPGGDVA